MERQRVELGPRQESVWEYPRSPGLKASGRRIKVALGGVTLAYRTHAKRVLETSHLPMYYVPPEHVWMDHLILAGGTSFCERKAVAPYYDVEIGERKEGRAACFYVNPMPGCAVLKDYVAFYPYLMDVCWVDGEKVRAQEDDFYGGWITLDIVGLCKGGPSHWGW